MEASNPESLGPFNKLTAELRTMIWDMVLPHDDWIIVYGGTKRDPGKTTSLDLAITHTSIHIRKETLPRMLHNCTFRFQGIAEQELTRLAGVQTLAFYQQQITNWIQVAQQMPRSLLQTNAHFVITACDDLRRCEHGYVLRSFSLESSEPVKLREALIQLAHAIKPSRLVLEIGPSYHRFFGTSRNMSNSLCIEGGAHLSSNEAASIWYRFDLGRGTAEEACKAVEEQYEKKNQQIKTHARHRICPIRVEQQRLLERLAETKQHMLELIKHLLSEQKEALKGRSSYELWSRSKGP